MGQRPFLRNPDLLEMPESACHRVAVQHSPSNSTYKGTRPSYAHPTSTLPKPSNIDQFPPLVLHFSISYYLDMGRVPPATPSARPPNPILRTRPRVTNLSLLIYSLC